MSDILNRASTKDFNVIRKISSGNFGHVYLVQNKQNKQYYAMKKVLKNLDYSDPKIDSFSIEKAIMLNSHSFWVVKLFCCFQDSHALYYAMDIMSGKNLEHLVKDIFPNMDEGLVHYYGAAALMGINALHKIGYFDNN